MVNARGLTRNREEEKHCLSCLTSRQPAKGTSEIDVFGQLLGFYFFALPLLDRSTDQSPLSPRNENNNNNDNNDDGISRAHFDVKHAQLCRASINTKL